MNYKLVYVHMEYYFNKLMVLNSMSKSRQRVNLDSDGKWGSGYIWTGKEINWDIG